MTNGTPRVAEPPTANPSVPARRVAFLGCALLVAALVLHVVILSAGSPPKPLHWLPWPALLGAFWLAEIKLVHFEFRSEAQSFSLHEIPLIVGLFALPSSEYMLAAVTGTVVGLIYPRRQRGVKLLVNTGHVWLAAGTAVALFRWLAPTVDASPSVWIAALVTAVISGAVNMAATSAAVALTQGITDVRGSLRAIVVGSLETLTTASVALAGVILLIEQPAAVWLLLVPAAVVFLSFRAYSSEKRKHDTLEVLYQSSRILHDHPEVEEAVHSLLEQARSAFRARVGELVLFGETSEDSVLRSSVADGVGVVEGLVRIEPDATEFAYQRIVEQGRPLLIRVGSDDGAELHPYMASRGFSEALMAPLTSEDRVVGAFLLADPLVETTHYRTDDLDLFVTLALQTSVSLENGRLDKTLMQLRELKDQLRYQAHHDALTGLPNRTLFTEEVQVAIDASDGPQHVAVLWVDLDEFKTINDTFGHEAGDTVLCDVARRLDVHCRHGDIAARLGGDAFGLILRDLTSPRDAVEVAQRILDTSHLPVRVNGRNLPIAYSVGVAVQEAGENGSELIRNAEVAMYRAKNDGKERLALYAPEMHAEVAHRLMLREELHQGIARGELRAFYQPLVNLHSGSVMGFEALVRWQHPERGLLTPDHFLDVASASDLILRIDQFVLMTACATAERWFRSGYDITMNVNLSARQITSPDLYAVVMGALEDTGLDPHRLVLEITERELVDDRDETRESLQALRTAGVQIAIDDFGTGYSSLAYLRSFPVDTLKVPKPFVDDIERDDQRVLARAVIDMSSALGLRTVAEGIESLVQRDLLRAWGCDVGQGYIFHRPMDVERADRVVQKEGVTRPDYADRPRATRLRVV